MLYTTKQPVTFGDGARRPVATGWLPPMPDLRDYTVDTAEVADLATTLFKKKKATQPTDVDLRQWCSPVEDQMNLGSCTANAGVGIVEYFERRAFGNHIEGSRLFLYKVTRNLMNVTGDTGAWLRNVMGALALCGVSDEKYWPYSLDGTSVNPNWDSDASGFHYAIADNYEAVKYFCHDPQGSGTPKDKVLATVKEYLAAGIPSMFGFWGFPSFDSSSEPGAIPFPCPGEDAQWGHAIVAVGFDDKKTVTNTVCNKKTTGAFLIRNSWGKSWGDKGYGWMPYDYVLSGLAMDFWSLISMNWIETKEFQG